MINIDADIIRRKARAILRRKALADAGCATYEMGLHAGRQAIILCVCCGMSSVHGADIRSKFCAFCEEYHREWGGVQP